MRGAAAVVKGCRAGATALAMDATFTRRNTTETMNQKRKNRKARRAHESRNTCSTPRKEKSISPAWQNNTSISQQQQQHAAAARHERGTFADRSPLRLERLEVARPPDRLRNPPWARNQPLYPRTFAHLQTPACSKENKTNRSHAAVGGHVASRGETPRATHAVASHSFVESVSSAAVRALSIIVSVLAHQFRRRVPNLSVISPLSVKKKPIQPHSNNHQP